MTEQETKAMQRLIEFVEKRIAQAEPTMLEFGEHAISVELSSGSIYNATTFADLVSLLENTNQLERE